jgi:hypothetical protein
MTTHQAQTQPRAASPGHSSRLVCVQCGRRSGPREFGWRVYLAGGYDIGELEVGVYCPECAAREFGHS